MATSSSRSLQPSTPQPVSLDLPEHRKTIEATRLSYLTADAIESVEEAVAMIIELGELAIAHGGNEGSLPPLHAIAVDEFGKLRVVDEDTTNEHPVRALVRFLKSLVSARDFSPELRELLYRNSGRDDELDYTEEFVSALSPLAPADRTETISAVAKRLRARRQGIALLSERHRIASDFAPLTIRRPPSVPPNPAADRLARQRRMSAFAVLALLATATVMGYLWGRGQGQSEADASPTQPEAQVTASTGSQDRSTNLKSSPLPVASTNQPTASLTAMLEDLERSSDRGAIAAGPEPRSAAGETATRAGQSARPPTRVVTKRGWAAPKWPDIERWDAPSPAASQSAQSASSTFDWSGTVGDRWETPRRVTSDRPNPPSRGVTKGSSAANSSLERPIKWPGRVVPVDRTKTPTGNIDPKSKSSGRPNSIGAR